MVKPAWVVLQLAPYSEGLDPRASMSVVTCRCYCCLGQFVILVVGPPILWSRAIRGGSRGSGHPPLGEPPNFIKREKNVARMRTNTLHFSN